MLLTFFVFTVVMAVALLVHDNEAPVGTSLAAGVLSSLVASAIIWAVQLVAVVRPAVRHRDAGSAPQSVTPKGSLEPDYWLDFLRNAKTEFFIAGHSLGKWCSQSNRAEFSSHLRRIMNQPQGRVTLVMLHPESHEIARLQRATSIDYSARVHVSLQVLADVCHGLEPAARQRLTIAALRPPLNLPYMVVGNDDRLVAAAYLGSSDNDDVPCVELQRASPGAAAFYDDFHKLAGLGTEPDLPDPPTTAEASQSARRLGRRFGRTRRHG